MNDAIHKEMEKEGYVLVGQGYGFNSNSPYWRYIHKERFNIIVIQDEPMMKNFSMYFSRWMKMK